MTNRERAARFVAAAHSYGSDYEAMIDLLTDALHLWGTEEFDKCLRIARGHYLCELEKEESSDE